MPPIPGRITTRINMLSGGIASWAAGKLVAERYGTECLLHLFADTMYEDDDLYRFLPEAVANIGGKLKRIADGRTPWEVFMDQKFIGNTRVDMCSRILKRELTYNYLVSNYDPAKTVLYVGIASHEAQRFYGKNGRPGIKDRWLPFTVHAPLLWKPDLGRCDMLAWLEREGVDPPRMYDEGFPHNNCKGACVKAGISQWALLLKKRPEVYAEIEEFEHKFQDTYDTEVTILRDRRGGETKPLSLTVLRERIEDGEVVSRNDWGKGCQCMLDGED